MGSRVDDLRIAIGTALSLSASAVSVLSINDLLHRFWSNYSGLTPVAKYSINDHCAAAGYADPILDVATKIGGGGGGSGYSSTLLALNPALHLKHTEPSGTTLTDSSTNANHGLYGGTFTLAQSEIMTNEANTSVLFNGGYGKVSGIAAYNAANFTINVWVRTVVANGVLTLMERDHASLGRFWTLRSVSAPPLITFSVFNSVGTNFVKSGVTTLLVATNYMITARLSAGVMTVFLNGVQETGSTTITGSMQTTGTAPITVGMGHGGDSQANPGYYPINGKQQASSFFPTALSDANILALYNAGIAA